MTEAATCTGNPGHIRHPRSVNRMVGLETAVKMLGKQQDLADALAIDERTLRSKLNARLGVSDSDLLAAAKALEARAAYIAGHAAKLRAEAGA